MTIIDVLKAAAEKEKFPEVESKSLIRHAKSRKGVVTVIKSSGIAVRFEGMNYDKWFWEKESDDKRSKYMSQLILCK